MKKYQLPDGVQDFLPAECRTKRLLESRLRRLFSLHGYEEVETPSFEFYDVFSGGIGGYGQEHMIKFFDLKGRIMVLRPDLTIPIARMIGTGMAARESIRLFYIQNAFAVNDYNIGQRSEFTQAGVELVGRGGSEADAESISLAIKSLLAAGIADFKLDIGQVGFYKGLLKGSGIGGENAALIQELIDMKNTVELEYRLAAMDIPAALKEKLLALPGLFGGREVIGEARALSENPACDAALDNLAEVYGRLCDYGYEQYLSVDLGMLNKLGYYSGIVFRGISHEIGFPILSGGRYDALNGEYGTPRPAIGFALGIKRALIVLERQNALIDEPAMKTLICASPAAACRAARRADELRANGRAVIVETGLAPEALAKYKDDKTVEEIIYYE